MFLHAVKEGPANRSFGLQVAALAGVPRAVVAQAREVLASLERVRQAEPPPMSVDALDQPQQMGLFVPEMPNPAIEALREIEPDELTPKQALEALYRLKALL